MIRKIGYPEQTDYTDFPVSGGLYVKKENGKFFWALEDSANGPYFSFDDHFDWDEIPESLFNELMRYQDSLDSE